MTDDVPFLYDKKDPVLAIPLPCKITVHFPGARPKEFDAGDFFAVNLSDHSVYFQKRERMQTLYRGRGAIAEGFLTGSLPIVGDPEPEEPL